MAKILVIDDDRSIRRTLELAFKDSGYDVMTAGTVSDGRKRWIEHNPDLVLLDLMLPDGDGLELLEEANKQNFSGMVIMITGHQDLDKAITAMRTGAFNYIHKPINLDELELSIQRALSTQELERKVAITADESDFQEESGKIVGVSKRMIDLHKEIGLASRGNANILITGESGTGKELVAKAIHRHAESNGPLISINCSAFAPTLLESELFGHEKGAFTGANQAKPGRFELASNGALFLDEIGDLELPLQVKLLRVLQERTFETVGGTQTKRFNARVIAATNRDLVAMVKEGKFRDDLYYRLKVIEIRIPPLRERKEDIEQLTRYLLGKVNQELRRKVTKVPQDVLDSMIEYDWPGNVRELENRITSGVMLSPGDYLNVEIPAIGTLDLSMGNANGDSSQIFGWNRSLEDVEKEHIEKVLKGCRFNYGKVCEVLGVSRPTLRRKMEQYGLKTD